MWLNGGSVSVPVMAQYANQLIKSNIKILKILDQLYFFWQGREEDGESIKNI